MKLTWRDAVTAVVMTAVIGIYLAYLADTGGWLISSTRGTAGLVLALGAAGGCALGRGDELQAAKSPGLAAYTALTSLLGLTALITGVLAVVAADATALAVLFGTTMALWVLSTARHALATTPPGAELTRDTHEVIERRQTHH